MSVPDRSQFMLKSPKWKPSCVFLAYIINLMQILCPFTVYCTSSAAVAFEAGSKCSLMRRTIKDFHNILHLHIGTILDTLARFIYSSKTTATYYHDIHPGYSSIFHSLCVWTYGWKASSAMPFLCMLCTLHTQIKWYLDIVVLCFHVLHVQMLPASSKEKWKRYAHGILHFYQQLSQTYWRYMVSLILANILKLRLALIFLFQHCQGFWNLLNPKQLLFIFLRNTVCDEIYIYIYHICNGQWNK